MVALSPFRQAGSPAQGLHHVRAIPIRNASARVTQGVGSATAAARTIVAPYSRLSREGMTIRLPRGPFSQRGTLKTAELSWFGRLRGSYVDGRTISSAISGMLVLATTDNPLRVTSSGSVTATASGDDAIDGCSGTSWSITNSGAIG